MLFSHVLTFVCVCVHLNVNKSAMLVLTFILLSREKTRDYCNTTELGVPQNRAPRSYDICRIPPPSAKDGLSV